MAEVVYRVERADGGDLSSQEIADLRMFVLMGEALYSSDQPIVISVPREIPDWLKTILQCSALEKIVPQPGDTIFVNRQRVNEEITIDGYPECQLVVGIMYPRR